MAVEDWPLKSIEELKAPTNGAIAIGPFGSRMKSDCYVPTGVEVIRGTNISDTRVLIGDMVCITPQLADQLGNAIVHANDLVFPHRGSIGLVGIVPRNKTERYALSSSLMKLTCDRKQVEPLFLFYFFRSDEGRYELLKNASTVGTPGIGQPLSSLRSIKVPLPPLAEQKAIAAVLGALDDKIELNRRMNATLEAMARALFQSWFVDFDPVRAKLDGRQPVGLDQGTAALFPDSFQDSTLGPIPHGWRAAHLEEIATVGSGKRPEYCSDVLSPECNIPIYGGGGRIGYVTSALYDKPILLTGRVGTLGLIFRTAEPSWPSDNTLTVEPQPGLLDFTYFILKGFDLLALNRGSTQPLLTQTDLKRQALVLPAKDVVKAFANVSEPIFRQITSNERESRTLATLRDWLLPKLLSGELRVVGDELLAEEASANP